MRLLFGFAVTSLFSNVTTIRKGDGWPRYQRRPRFRKLLIHNQLEINISHFQQLSTALWMDYVFPVDTCVSKTGKASSDLQTLVVHKLLLDASTDDALRLKLFVWHRGQFPDLYCFIVMPLRVLTGKSSGTLNHESSGVFLSNFSCNKAEPDDTFR